MKRKRGKWPCSYAFLQQFLFINISEDGPSPGNLLCLRFSNWTIVFHFFQTEMQLVLWQDSTIISLANYTHTWPLVSPPRFRLSLLRSYKEKCSDKSSDDSVKRKSVYFAKVVLKQNDITLYFIATLSRIHPASLFLIHAVSLKQFEIGNWVINIVTWIRLYCYNHRFRKMKAIVTKATFLSLCNHCHYHYEEWLNTSVNWKPRRFKQRMNFGTVLSILTAHECLVLKPVLYL